MKNAGQSPGVGGQVVPFPARSADQVGFERAELMRILDLYGRMVAAGEWRDYAMDFDRHAATFAAFLALSLYCIIRSNQFMGVTQFNNQANSACAET